MKFFRIIKWGELFENNRSRTVINLDWVSIPNRHDGENYTKIVTHQDGAEIFAAWVLLVQVASKCNPRGLLVKDNGQPHTSESLSLKTRAPKLWFDKALEYLVKNTDWLEFVELSDTCQANAIRETANCEEGKGSEGNGSEGKGMEDMPKEAAFWNANCGDLPKVLTMGSKRMTHLYKRRQDRFWVANLEAAVVKVRQSDFCNARIKNSTWRASFDWIIERPDAVAKIMEGKYDSVKPADKSTPDHTTAWKGCAQ